MNILSTYMNIDRVNLPTKSLRMTLSSYSFRPRATPVMIRKIIMRKNRIVEYL